MSVSTVTSPLPQPPRITRSTLVWPPTPAEAARKPRRPRRLTPEAVIKQLSKAGIDLARARFEFKPDGTFAVIPCKPEPAAPENEWFDEMKKGTKR
jgi:hypothetical protein